MYQRPVRSPQRNWDLEMKKNYIWEHETSTWCESICTPLSHPRHCIEKEKEELEIIYGWVTKWERKMELRNLIANRQIGI